MTPYSIYLFLTLPITYMREKRSWIPLLCPSHEKAGFFLEEPGRPLGSITQEVASADTPALSWPEASHRLMGKLPLSEATGSPEGAKSA